MASVSEFVKSPSWGILNKCTNDQLLKIAEHFGVDVCGRSCKAEIKAVLETGLVIKSVMVEQSEVDPKESLDSAQSVGLSVGLV